MPDPRLGAVIRSIRKKSGLNMVGFARDLGVTQATVSRWESGKQEPNLAVLASLLTRLGQGDAEERQLLEEAINELAGRHGAAGPGGEAAQVLLSYRERAGELAKQFAGEAQKALEAGPDEPLVSILRFYNQFRQEPEHLRAFFEAAGYLSVHEMRARKEKQTAVVNAKFGDLSEKEVEQLEDLLYLIRRGDPREVRDLTRRAAAFRTQIEESERKHTVEAKTQRRDRR